MRLFVRLCLLPALFFALPATAQITFDLSDLAGPGDAVVRYNDTLPTYGPGASGPGQVWDFSMALTHETVTSTISTVGSTPYAASFASSNLAMTNNGADYAYFNNTAASSVAMGGAGDPLAIGQTIVAPFNDPLTTHQFPRTFGSAFTDSYSFEVEVDGSAFGVHSARLRHRGFVRDTTDGHGQLITPAGTYDALRVRSTDQTTDSIWIRVLSFLPWTLFQTMADTSVAYTWLAKEGKLPVAEMAFDSLGMPSRFTHSSVAPITTGVGAHDRGMGITAYPLPARDVITLQFPRGAIYERAEVLTMDGRRMAVLPLTTGDRHDLAVHGWPAGVYAVRAWRPGGADPEVLRISVE